MAKRAGGELGYAGHPAGRARAAGISESCVRAVPYDSRHSGGFARRARPDAPGQSQDDRRRPAAQYHRQSWRLDHERTGPEARMPHAAQPDAGSRSARPAGLSRDAQMTTTIVGAQTGLTEAER